MAPQARTHAGIATQNVVERELRTEGLTRHDLGREAFVEQVWAWKAKSGGTITTQMRRLGDSVDWSRERFTFDDGLSHAVRKVFVDLYGDGHIYRGQPHHPTGAPGATPRLSDIEVEHEDDPGRAHLHPLPAHRPIRLGRRGHHPAPETMLGDSAVACTPMTSRYASMVGKTVMLPLMDREIPIVADDGVELEFGTGRRQGDPRPRPPGLSRSGCATGSSRSP